MSTEGKTRSFVCGEEVEEEDQLGVRLGRDGAGSGESAKGGCKMNSLPSE